MGVSENRGTPKSSILIRFSVIFTIHFGGKIPLFLVQHPNSANHGGDAVDLKAPITFSARKVMPFCSWNQIRSVKCMLLIYLQLRTYIYIYSKYNYINII